MDAQLYILHLGIMILLSVEVLTLFKNLESIKLLFDPCKDLFSRGHDICGF